MEFLEKLGSPHWLLQASQTNQTGIAKIYAEEVVWSLKIVNMVQVK